MSTKTVLLVSLAMLFSAIVSGLIQPHSSASAPIHASTLAISSPPPTFQVQVTSGYGFEQSIVINPTDSTNLIIATPGTALDCGYVICAGGYVLYSRDGGYTWSESAGTNTTLQGGDPWATFDGHGNVYFSYLLNHTVEVAKSTDQGATFQPAVAIDQNGTTVRFKSGATGTIVPVFGLSVDWDKIAADSSTFSPYEDNIYGLAKAFVDTNKDGNADWFGLIVTRLRAGASTWDSPLAISSDSSSGYSSDAFPMNVAVGGDGKVYVAELAQGGGRITIDRSDDGGGNFSHYTAVSTSSTGFTRLGQYAAIAVDPAHPNVVYLAFHAVSSANSGRGEDIFVAKSTDFGVTWASSITAHINDDSTSYLQERPFVSVGANGRVDLVWYDLRINGCIPSCNPDAYFSYSSDGGTTFSANIRLTPHSQLTTDYVTIASLSSKAFISYTYDTCVAYGSCPPSTYVTHVTLDSLANFPFPLVRNGKVGNITLGLSQNKSCNGVTIGNAASTIDGIGAIPIAGAVGAQSTTGLLGGKLDTETVNCDATAVTAPGDLMGIGGGATNIFSRAVNRTLPVRFAGPKDGSGRGIYVIETAKVTTLTGNYPAGSSSTINVYSTAGFHVGDQIQIDIGTNAELNYVASLPIGGLTLTTLTSLPHSIGAPVYRGNWVRCTSTCPSGGTEDYAFLSLFYDGSNDRYFMVAAGLSGYATKAMGQLIAMDTVTPLTTRCQGCGRILTGIGVVVKLIDRNNDNVFEQYQVMDGVAGATTMASPANIPSPGTLARMFVIGLSQTHCTSYAAASSIDAIGAVTLASRLGRDLKTSGMIWAALDTDLVSADCSSVTDTTDNLLSIGSGAVNVISAKYNASLAVRFSGPADGTGKGIYASCTAKSTTLTAAAKAGYTSLTVKSTSGFKAGDEIQIDTGSSAEIRYVASVPSSTSLTLTSAVNLAHGKGAPVYRGNYRIATNPDGSADVYAMDSYFTERISRTQSRRVEVIAGLSGYATRLAQVALADPNSNVSLGTNHGIVIDLHDNNPPDNVFENVAKVDQCV